MRKSSLILLFSIVCLFVSAHSLVLDGKFYTVDTISNFSVGPGTQHIQLRLQSDVRLDVYFLKTHTTNPYISFRAELGRDSIYGRERTSALALRKSKPGDVYFAGTNADFFDLSAAYSGYPLSGCIVQNEIAKIPTSTRPVAAFQEDKTPFIGRMTFEGKITSPQSSREINGINHIREAEQLILYNRHNGTYTRTNQYGTEVMVELVSGNSWKTSQTLQAKVKRVDMNKGNSSIPEGHAVLSGHGTAAAFLNTLKVNDLIEINLDVLLDGTRISATQMIGGDNRNPMLNNGILETVQIWNELHPRTAFGYSKDKQNVIFCVVDGRGISAGVNTTALAQLMKSAGAYTAFNMDGGGSSGMYIKEYGIVNRPSDGSERSVGNSLFVTSSAPSDNNITSISANVTSVKLQPNTTFKPVFMGYNQYGILINKNVSGVILTSPPAIGQVLSDGIFKATGTQDGYISASYGSYQTKIYVDIITSEDNQQEESISEDFSSLEWDAEFKRLNEDYTTLGPGQAFLNMNNVSAYMNKYAFDGAVIGEVIPPNCESEGVIHQNDKNAAVGFRFRNSGESYMTFPEMKNAGTMQIHVKNANNTAATTLALQKFENGVWVTIHTFNLRPKNSYQNFSVDEVLSYNINSGVPIKLRLFRGDRFITLFRVDISPFAVTKVENHTEFRFRQKGRTLIFDNPAEITLYNMVGMMLLKKTASSQVEIPASVGTGLFLLQTKYGVQKLVLK